MLSCPGWSSRPCATSPRPLRLWLPRSRPVRPRSPQHRPRRPPPLPPHPPPHQRADPTDVTEDEAEAAIPAPAPAPQPTPPPPPAGPAPAVSLAVVLALVSAVLAGILLLGDRDRGAARPSRRRAGPFAGARRARAHRAPRHSGHTTDVQLP